jgi:lipoyl(octanoyl) transferase
MIQSLYLGRMGYAEALRLQDELVDLRQRGRLANVLLLLEHPPVLTLGRNAKRANVLASDELLQSRGVTLHEINRGGDVTYHGPGQLIGYPIFDLRSLRHPITGNRLGPVDFVRLIEEALIRLCGDFGLQAGRISGLTGVWCGLPKPEVSPAQLPRGGRKIAAIGIHVSRGVTSHGFAFNITTDLSGFALINPCGITDRPVTSLAREVRDPAALPGLDSLAQKAACQIGQILNEPVVAVDNLQALRAEAEPEFPAEDTPLEIPPEIERLQQRPGRPVRA